MSTVLPEIVRRVLPAEKISDEEKLRLQHEIEKELQKFDLQKYEKEVEDRATARALAQAEVARGNAWTNVLAAVHRPAWSLVALAVFVWSMLSEQLGMKHVEFTDLHKDIMETVIVFYFGGRSIEKSLSIFRQGKT